MILSALKYYTKIKMVKYFIMLFILISGLKLFSQPPCNPAVLKANFTYTQNCFTKTINFTNTSTISNGSVTTINWDFGNGFSSNQSSPVYTYANTGTYYVTLTLTHSSGCTSVKSDSIKVLVSPFANFLYNADSVCPDVPINFANASIGSGLAYQWYFRDVPGNFNAVGSTLANPVHLFSNAIGTAYTSYPIKLTITDAVGCVSSMTKVIYIKNRPLIDFQEFGNFKRCENIIGNGSINDTAVIYNFSNYASISSYQINWGNGAGFVNAPALFNNTNPATHIYDSIANYPVQIKAYGINGCNSIFTDTFKIITIPLPDFSSLPYNSGCAPFKIFTINNSSGVTYTTKTYINWGDNVTDTLPVGTMPGDTLWHTYSLSTCINKLPQPYTIVLTTKNECGAPFKSYGPINVFVPPKADVNTSVPIFCAGNPITFQNLSIPNYCANDPRTLFTWNFGDTIIGPLLATVSNPTPNYIRTYNLPGNYSVILTATNNSPVTSGKPGCGTTVDTAFFSVVKTDADFSFNKVCLGNPTQFTDLSTAPGGTIVSRNWNFGDLTSITSLPNPSHTYSLPGDFTVKLTVTSSLGCTDIKYDTITVDSLPKSMFNYSNTCLGDTMFFNNLSLPNSDSIVSVIWDFGDGYTSTIKNPYHIFQSSGTFAVKLSIINSKMCQKDTIINAIVYPNPIASFYTDSICSGYKKVFSNNSVGVGGALSSYLWMMGDGIGTSSHIDTTYIYPGFGTYPAYLKVSDIHGCKDDTTINIYLGPVPVTNFTYSNTCFGSNIVFNNTTNDQGIPISSTSWNFGDNSSSSLTNPTHQYTSLNSFNVKLEVINVNGCVDSITKIIVLDTLPFVNFAATTVCKNDTTLFTDLSHAYSGLISSWNWNFGDGNTSVLKNPKHIYSNAGTYNVNLSITDSKSRITTSKSATTTTGF